MFKYIMYKWTTWYGTCFEFFVSVCVQDSKKSFMLKEKASGNNGEIIRYIAVVLTFFAR